MPAGPIPLASSVSDLAEELAYIIELNGQTMQAAAIIGQRVQAHADAWHQTPTHVMLAVAREWDRLGISRIDAGWGPLGDGNG